MATKIVFFGNERLATAVNTTTPVVKTLVNSENEVCALVVNNDKAMSRTQRESEIEVFASENNIPILQPKKLSEIAEQLGSYSADIGVLVAYGKIIPQSIIDIFPHGIINIHPSLLPLHRGSTPIESVILDGELETGVSIMSLVAAMDAGPIYKQAGTSLSGKESKQDLADSLLESGAILLAEILPEIMSGGLEAVEQNHNKATYDGQIVKADGIIDWTKSATQIEREVRAYLNWPKSRTAFGGIDCVITKASVLDEKVSGEPGSLFIHDKKLAVVCSELALVIDNIKPSGKNEMNSQSFLAGYSSRIGL
jgi:methionyl-tRNA formyltransferase